MLTFYFEVYDLDGDIKVGHVFAKDRDESEFKLLIHFGSYETIDLYECALAPLAVEPKDHIIIR